MPCNSDCNIATEFERGASKIFCLLDDLNGRRYSDLSWQGYHPSAWSQSYDKYCGPYDLGQISAELVRKIEQAGPANVSFRAKQWYVEHQKSKGIEVEIINLVPKTVVFVANSWEEAQAAAGKHLEGRWYHRVLFSLLKDKELNFRVALRDESGVVLVLKCPADFADDEVVKYLTTNMTVTLFDNCLIHGISQNVHNNSLAVFPNVRWVFAVESDKSLDLDPEIFDVRYSGGFADAG